VAKAPRYMGFLPLAKAKGNLKKQKTGQMIILSLSGTTVYGLLFSSGCTRRY
jgi:hypothetical protein